MLLSGQSLTHLLDSSSIVIRSLKQAQIAHIKGADWIHWDDVLHVSTTADPSSTQFDKNEASSEAGTA
jgi:hypothetical protein